MDLRTDLALEQHEINGKNEPYGTEKTEAAHGNARITQIKITNENGEKAFFFCGKNSIANHVI